MVKNSSKSDQDHPKASGSSSILDDERFNRVAADPRFRSFKQDSKHVELDKRFEKVLTNKKFEIKDDLFYNEASSSSDESSSDEDENEFEEVDEWEEEERKCYRDDVDETKRIAICNLDWDRINATDIFVLLNSFKPAQGEIKSVRIYMSEYGKQRLAEEKERGPKELVDLPEDVGKEDERTKMISTIKFANEEDEEMNKLGYVQNKLRKYQINRLRYYYAVAEFDCADTAVEVYEQLDGYEYLASSVTIDLRFIPDDMTFDEEPQSECCVLPDLNFYQTPNFINTALQQTKVRLTWEENNQDMSKKLQKAFVDVENNKEVAYLDEYLASDTENEEDSLSEYQSEFSDEEEGEGEEQEDEQEKEENQVQNESKEGVEKKKLMNKKDKKKDKISKYKNLLKSIEEEEERKKKEKSKFDIEINWGPELSEAADEGNQADSESDDEEEFDPDMTDEKRAKLAKKEQFKVSNKKKNKNKNKEKDDQKTETEDERKKREQANAELELLLMDSEDKDKKHFNYANFVENDKQVSKEKKSKKIQEDTFKFDSEDPRFAAIYDSHAFNLDPSNPKFKRTKAFKDMIQKKIKRSK